MGYAQVLVTSSQTARCTAQAVWDQFVIHYGLPESIIWDQGQNFESDLVLQLYKLAKVWKLHTSPFHPQMNGQCEQFNYTLINMLGTLPPNKKFSWRDMVPTLVHAYNCTRSTAMGFSPYYLVYGWKPQLPVDLYFGTSWFVLWYSKSGHEHHHKYQVCTTVVGDWSGHIKLPNMS